MYIYNVTIKIEKSIEQEWLNWMKEEHIKDVINTGLFHDYTFIELLEPTDEDGGKTFIVQYHTNNLSDYNKYIEEHATALREKAFSKFGNRFIAFRTLLKKHN